MGQNRHSDGGTPPLPSVEPDTEPGLPPTPRPSSISNESADVPLTMDSTVQPTRASQATSAANHHSVTTPSREESDERRGPGPRGGESNTTLQSIARPEATPAGVPHTRRFLRIENELDQVSASFRLLEKRLIKVEKEARFAWIIAGCAGLLAAAALLT